MATETENMIKRKAETLSLESPRSAKFKKMEDVQETGKPVPPTPASETHPVSTAIDSTRGNITIIHTQASTKSTGTRMQWTFPRSYLAARKRAGSPHPPQSPAPTTTRNDTELNTANLHGSYTPEAISIFYTAVTSESSVPSGKYSLHEYCQIYALAHFFGITDIFTDGETVLLRRMMTDETQLDAVRAATSFASIFRWRALVERCRHLLAKRVKMLEADLPVMNCGGLNILATKLDEAYEFLGKSGLLSEARK